MRRRTLSLLALCALAACDGAAARVAAPTGASAFKHFVTLGTGLTMGEQSGGVLYESQIATWPARLAARMGESFSVPSLQSPGCPAPLVAPLSMRRTLAGPITTTVSCAGRLGADALPAANVALGGATAWDAFHMAPRNFTGVATTIDQARYPFVLPNTQTQVQAMQSSRPSLVGVELGLGEVLRAIRTGQVIVGTSYTQKEAWTVMLASAFTAVFDSLADSIKTSGASSAVFVGVPTVTQWPAWVAGDQLYQQRAALATLGITVGPECSTTTNRVQVAALVPALAELARTSGATQTLSCTDKPGFVDYVLTSAEVATIDQVVAAMNTAIKAAAEKRGYAYADIPTYARQIPFAAPTFTPSGLLTTDAPFGMATSLDGMFPSAYGHDLIADVVAAALNARYGWKIPIPVRPL